jgi:hypothetical protein
MKRVIVTIAILLCAVSAFADDHHGLRAEYDNGHHDGEYSRHNSRRGYERRDEREWRSRHVAYRPEYREVRELPPRQVAYRPEYRKAEPHLTISVQTPGLILSFLTGR